MAPHFFHAIFGIRAELGELDIKIWKTSILIKIGLYMTIPIYNSKLSNSEVSEQRYIIETSVENIIRLANCDPNYSERGSNVFK